MTTLASQNLFDEKKDFESTATNELKNPGVGSQLNHQQTSTSGSIVYSASVALPTDQFSTVIPVCLEESGKSLAHSPANFGTKIVICNKTPKEEVSEEDVSEDFIKNFNDHIGNQDNIQKARRLLKKMRQIGNLEPSSTPIDISAARKGLCLLTGLENHELKIIALDSLLMLLYNHELKIETAEGLVSFSINLMKRMNRTLMQSELISTQKKIAKVYNIVAELIQRHYGKKDIGGITKELRTELIETARTLEDLNTHEDAELKFMVSSALEGVKRLRDDRKELFELVEKLYYGAVSLLAMYHGDIYSFIESFPSIFVGIDPRLKHSWYDGSFVLNEMYKEALSDPVMLLIMQGLIQEKNTKLNWKFLYGAILHLESITINGSTASIRKSALEGHKLLSEEFPGILFFTNFRAFYKKPDINPMVHLCPPTLKDTNVLIRMRCVESLVKISQEAPDKQVRTKAKIEMIKRFKQEDDPAIQEYLQINIPASLEEQKNWIKEIGQYAFQTVGSDVPGIIIDEPKKNQDHSSATTTQITIIASQILTPASTPAPEIHNENKLSPATCSPDHSPANSPRQPNRIAVRLAKALGVEQEFFIDKIKFKGGIRIDGEDGLSFTEIGLLHLLEILNKFPEITKLDLSKFTLPNNGLVTLSTKLAETKVKTLLLPKSITLKEAKALGRYLQNYLGREITPENPEGFLLLGSALLSNGSIDESIKYFTQGIRLTEDHHSPKLILAHLYQKRGRAKLINGDIDLALKDLEEGLEIAPNDFKINFEMAKYYLDQKDYTQAALWVKKALEIKPEDVKAMYLLKLCE